MRELASQVPPGALLLLGALLVPFLRGRLRQLYLLALPVASFLHLWALPLGTEAAVSLGPWELDWLRVDRLSRVFGIVFHIAAFLGVLYALKVEDRIQNASALAYAGSAIAALFAGDLLTLFFFWEATAITSVFLVWARGTERARRAGRRYLVIQVGSGVLLLAGTLVHYQATGSLAFGELGLAAPGGWLIFLAFGIKAAFPFLHNWLQDAYPEATVTGAVFLSGFTTKLAIYALARSFAGTEILIPIGAAMTAFPIFFAVIENDLRRVLAYSLNNQLGFMVVGIGVGTEMALNGTAAHAFVHIVYKALLFMAMGAVLEQAKTIKASELGGLYKAMPWSAAFCIVGAASISAFPLTSGFVAKSLILTATAEEHHTIAFLVLLFASAGVAEHSGIKIPFFGFFGHDHGLWKKVKEAPLPMLAAMGGAAALCLGIGIWPGPLYSLLPYAVDYEPYTVTHVVTQLQLLLFAVLAFVWLWKVRLYPDEMRSTNLDFDWTYRRALPALLGALGTAYATLAGTARAAAGWLGRRGRRAIARQWGPQGLWGEPWPTGKTAMWAAILLAVLLLLYYF